MAKIIAIFAAVLLAGCATKTRVEFVPVPPAEPPVIERPALEIERLKAGDEPNIVIQAHRITIKQLMKWGLELEAALDAYRSKK